MISKKLKAIFGVSIIAFIVHGLEEYFTGFYDIDPIFGWVFNIFSTMSVPQATFLLFQIMFWLALTVLFIAITSDKWRLRLMVISGLIYILELHHFAQAISREGYSPGLISAFIFPIIGFFYWRELIKSFSLE